AEVGKDAMVQQEGMGELARQRREAGDLAVLVDRAGFSGAVGRGAEVSHSQSLLPQEHVAGTSGQITVAHHLTLVVNAEGYAGSRTWIRPGQHSDVLDDAVSPHNGVDTTDR